MTKVKAAVIGGVLVMVLWAPIAGAQVVRRNAADILQDRRDVREDILDIRQDTLDIEQDRRDLRADRTQLQADRRTGNTEAVKKDVQDIRADRKDLRDDRRGRQRNRKDLRGDLREQHQERRDLRSDIHDRRQLVHEREENDGAFRRLSPGNQKIARALFEAQTRPSGSTAGAPAPRSLDDIAAMKQSGQGWGVIAKDMRQQGLVQERNLGQVVRSGPAPVHDTVITSASGRSHVMAAQPTHAPSSAVTMRTAAAEGHPRAGFGAEMSRGHEHATVHGGGRGR